MTELQQYVSGASRRLDRQRWLDALPYWALATGALALLASITSKLLPHASLARLPESWLPVVLVAALITPLIGASLAIWRHRTSPLTAAAELDRRLDLHARVATAWAFSATPATAISPSIQFVLADAQSRLQGHQVDKLFPLRLQRGAPLAWLPLAIAAAITFLVADPVANAASSATDPTLTKAEKVEVTEELTQTLESLKQSELLEPTSENQAWIDSLLEETRSLRQRDDVDRAELLARTRDLQQELDQRAQAMTESNALRKALRQLAAADSNTSRSQPSSATSQETAAAAEMLRDLATQLNSPNTSPAQQAAAAESLRAIADQLDQRVEAERLERLDLELQREAALRDADEGRVSELDDQLSQPLDSQAVSELADRLRSSAESLEQAAPTLDTPPSAPTPSTSPPSPAVNNPDAGAQNEGYQNEGTQNEGTQREGTQREGTQREGSQNQGSSEETMPPTAGSDSDRPEPRDSPPSSPRPNEPTNPGSTDPSTPAVERESEVSQSGESGAGSIEPSTTPPVTESAPNSPQEASPTPQGGTPTANSPVSPRPASENASNDSGANNSGRANPDPGDAPMPEPSAGPAPMEANSSPAEPSAQDSTNPASSAGNSPTDAASEMPPSSNEGSASPAESSTAEGPSPAAREAASAVDQARESLENLQRLEEAIEQVEEVRRRLQRGELSPKGDPASASNSDSDSPPSGTDSGATPGAGNPGNPDAKGENPGSSGASSPPGSAPGRSNFASGAGQGSGQRSEAPDEVDFFNLRNETQAGEGESIVRGQVEGPNRVGPSGISPRDAVRRAMAREADPISEQKLPRSRRDQVRDYFERLRQGGR